MTSRHNVPPLDRATVEYLDRLYPERSPNPQDTEREIWMKAGERRLVVQLKLKLQQQEKNALNV